VEGSFFGGVVFISLVEPYDFDFKRLGRRVQGWVARKGVVVLCP
jgi:hypothetical protein